MAEAVVPNVVIMSDAILEEQTAADKEKRSAQTSNVIAIFRSKSKGNLSDNDINFLFDACFEAYQKTHERGFLKRQARNPLGMQNREGIRERNRRIGRSLNRPAVGAYRGRTAARRFLMLDCTRPQAWPTVARHSPDRQKRLLILQPGRCKPVLSPKRQRLRSRGSRRRHRTWRRRPRSPSSRPLTHPS
jgi:hypothetical protein